MNPIPADYPALLSELDRWQAGAAAQYPGVVPCRAGCSACCHGPFDISVADALLVREAVLALPEAYRDDLLERARAQMELATELEPGFAAPWDVGQLGEARFDALADALDEDPCPALDEAGRCRIYAHRPMICRLIGLGVATPDGHVIENACPIQDEYPEYAALPPQPFDLDAFGDAEEPQKFHAALVLFGSAGASEYETTVAGAILLASPRDAVTPRAGEGAR